MVGFLYPKIDSAVSSHTNHLLKAPFNIHSSSLLISVPVNPMNFDITKIPTIQQINNNEVSIKDYIESFKTFITRLKNENKENNNSMKKQNGNDKMTKVGVQKINQVQ